MDSHKPYFTELRNKYQEFLDKTSLTDKATLRTKQIINQIHLLALVFASTSVERQAQIVEEVEKVGKKLDEKVSNQSLMSYFFARSNETVSL